MLLKVITIPTSQMKKLNVREKTVPFGHTANDVREERGGSLCL